jgi:hypothetical protein
MARMKVLLRVVVGLLLLLVVAGIAAFVFVDSLVKKGVERGGTHALGVETRLAEASIGLTSGQFGLEGLTVANPPGFELPSFLELRSAHLELPLSKLLEDEITIPALTLEGIVLDLERNASGTNYGLILENLERFESTETPPVEEEPTEPGKTFTLQRLVIRDVRATVNLLPAGGDLTKLSLAIPEIAVEDVGTGMTLSQISAVVVKLLIQAAIQSGGGVLPADLLADLKGRMEGLEDIAHEQLQSELGKLEDSLQEQAEKLGPEAQKALEEASKQLGGQLEGLLPKKKKE